MQRRGKDCARFYHTGVPCMGYFRLEINKINKYSLCKERRTGRWNEKDIQRGHNNFHAAVTATAYVGTGRRQAAPTRRGIPSPHALWAFTSLPQNQYNGSKWVVYRMIKVLLFSSFELFQSLLSVISKLPRNIVSNKSVFSPLNEIKKSIKSFLMNDEMLWPPHYSRTFIVCNQ